MSNRTLRRAAAVVAVTAVLSFSFGAWAPAVEAGPCGNTYILITHYVSCSSCGCGYGWTRSLHQEIDDCTGQVIREWWTYPGCVYWDICQCWV